MKKRLAEKIVKNSMYGTLRSNKLYIDIESKFEWNHSSSFISGIVSCKTCKPILIGGTFVQRVHDGSCPECGGAGIREMDWVEKVIHGRIDKEK